MAKGTGRSKVGGTGRRVVQLIPRLFWLSIGLLHPRPLRSGGQTLGKRIRRELAGGLLEPKAHGHFFIDESLQPRVQGQLAVELRHAVSRIRPITTPWLVSTVAISGEVLLDPLELTAIEGVAFRTFQVAGHKLLDGFGR